MNIDDFQRLGENLKRNIAEIKSTIKTSNLSEPISVNSFERIIYLFQSITKSMVEIGNSIIIESDFRKPLNTADVFISLAEHDVIHSSIVPGLKKASIAMPKIQNLEDVELLEIISSSLDDLGRCLNAFKKYFELKKSEV